MSRLALTAAHVEAAALGGRIGVLTPSALADANVGIVVLDCLGYTVALKQAVRRLARRPVLPARTVLARAVAELV